MTADQVCTELNISRKTLFNRMKAGRITPINRNPALDKQPLKFAREDVERLAQTRPAKAGSGGADKSG